MGFYISHIRTFVEGKYLDNTSNYFKADLFFTFFAITYSPYSYQAARRAAVGCGTAL